MDVSRDRSHDLTMKVIPAGKFKEQCLSLLDHVDPEGIVITKRGMPVAKLVPIERAGKPLIGRLKGRIQIKGDVYSTGVRWNVNGQP